MCNAWCAMLCNATDGPIRRIWPPPMQCMLRLAIFNPPGATISISPANLTCGSTLGSHTSSLNLIHFSTLSQSKTNAHLVINLSHHLSWDTANLGLSIFVFLSNNAIWYFAMWMGGGKSRQVFEGGSGENWYNKVQTTPWVPATGSPGPHAKV